MNPSDVPPTVFVESALKACGKAGIEATIIYTVSKSGRTITRAATNAKDGQTGLARHLAAVRIQDGAIERAAVALHELRPEPPPGVELLPEEKAAIDKCAVCGSGANWSALEEIDRAAHREIVKVVVAHALTQQPASGLVTV